MKLIVSGNNIELTKSLKEYVETKSQKLEAHFDFVREVHVFLTVDKNKSISNNQHAEATIHVSGAVMRVSSTSPSMYASIDLLIDKMDRSLSKYKTKLLHRAKSSHGESIRKISAVEEPVKESETVAGIVNEESDYDAIYYTYSDEEAELLEPQRS
jgi:putative sigma-54 modulation protein